MSLPVQRPAEHRLVGKQRCKVTLAFSHFGQYNVRCQHEVGIRIKSDVLKTAGSVDLIRIFGTSVAAGEIILRIDLKFCRNRNVGHYIHLRARRGQNSIGPLRELISLFRDSNYF